MTTTIELLPCDITVEYDYDHNLRPNPWADQDGVEFLGGLVGVNWIALHVQFSDTEATGRCAEIIARCWFSGEIEDNLINEFSPY